MLSALQSSRRPDSSESASLGPSSTLGNVSHGFRSRFEMLFYPENSPLSDQGFHTKQEDIQACLRGKVDESTGNEMVNLWQLRELSLSKGGLLSADLRKRAWPTLLACHEQVFPELAQQDDYVAPRRVQPDPGNIRSLQHDVSQTIWNVQDCLVASRQHRQIQNEKMDRFLEEQRQQSQKKVTFAPSLVQASPKPHTPAPKAPETPPVVIATSSAASGARVHQDDTTSVLSHDDSATGLFDDSSWSVRTHETAFTLSSRVIRWRKASSQEQKILYNVISSVLQTGPPIHGNDEVYFHYNGLQDLTALLLINLESPSLTSIVLEKLARWHLRDALRPDRSHLEIVLECCFMPLLESVDSGLYNHLVNKGLTLPSFATQWIACWFAQDIPDAPMASRFLDAFIVGHALLPLYVAVAFVASHREWIWSECENLSSLYATLRGIPFRALTHGLDLQDEEDVQQGMMRVEKILETALLYMKRLPPSDLLEISRNRVVSGEVLEQISTITMFGPENVPTFVTGPHSPTDYAVLQQAKWFRTKLSEPIFSLKQTGGAKNEELPGLAGSPTLEEEDEPEGSHIPSPESYTLTCVALGISNVTSSTRSRRALGSLWMLLFVGVLFAYLAVVLPPQFHLFGTQSTAVPLHLSRGSEPDSRRASDLTNPKLQGTLGLSQLKFTFQGFATSVVTENVLMEGDYSDMIKESRALPSLSSVFKINWFAVFRQQFHLLQAVWRDLLSPFRHRKASAESSKEDLTASG